MAGLNITLVRLLWKIFISNKDRQVQTYITNTTLFALYHSDKFQPLTRSTNDTFQQQGQQNKLPEVEFNFCSV
jgi:hypothetical protein